MSYLVTAMRQEPDVGFTAVSRHTAEGARDLARRFLADGLQEVEVRDDRGNLRTLQDLDEPGSRHSAHGGGSISRHA